jgi:hypothetical protein
MRERLILSTMKEEEIKQVIGGETVMSLKEFFKIDR